LKNQSEIQSDPAVFTKKNPNTSKNIQFFTIMVFIWIGLNLNTPIKKALD
jgi:hypothetical protein